MRSGDYEFMDSPGSSPPQKETLVDYVRSLDERLSQLLTETARLAEVSEGFAVRIDRLEREVGLV
jgi:hypothetical protein